MITKVLKPEKHGAIVYNNKTGSSRLVNYMEHEAKENKDQALFFNQSQDMVDPKIVVQHIDNNVKGLKAEDAKFFSLIISPSQGELKHIESDEEKLRSYTRQVMDNYAQNFKLKGGKMLGSDDLVWYAVIHRERKYHGTDQEVTAGKAQSGQVKPGDQTHIHIIVSRRDAQQKISLTPNGSKERFNIKDWQERNARDFQQMFGYQKQTYYSKEEFKEVKLRERINKFIQKEGLDRAYYNPDRVVYLAKEQQFDWKFGRNLKTLEDSLSKGLRPANPYEGLQRDGLLKEYQKLRGYQVEDPYEKRTTVRIVNLRHNFLKEYGFALGEGELNIREVLKAQQAHPNRWKFTDNFRKLEAAIMQEGQVPKDYLKRLQALPTEQEVAERKAAFKQEKLSSPLDRNRKLVKQTEKKETANREVAPSTKLEKDWGRDEPSRGGGRIEAMGKFFKALSQSDQLPGEGKDWGKDRRTGRKKKHQREAKRDGGMEI